MKDLPRITAPSSDQSWGFCFFHCSSVSASITAVCQIHQAPRTVWHTTKYYRKWNCSHKYRFLSFYWIKWETSKSICKQDLYSWKCQRERIEKIPESSLVFAWTFKYFLLIPSAFVFSFTSAEQTMSAVGLCCHKNTGSWQHRHTCLAKDTIQRNIQKQLQAQIDLKYIAF